MLDGRRVGSAIRRDYAVPVLEIASVVADRVAEEVGEAAAGFLENDLRGARVPEFCARAWMNVDVAFLGSDEGDLEADRAAAADIFEPKMFDHAVHAFARMIAGHGQVE